MTPTLSQRLSLQQFPSERVVMRQRWSELLFLHWTVDAERLAARLPAGLTLDTFQDQAYLGVVPFQMEKLRPAGFPALPWLSNFNELNLRTYVHDANGKPGVWFFSLDCDQPVAVAIARTLFHLPYQFAKMSFHRESATGLSVMNSVRRGTAQDSETQRYSYGEERSKKEPSYQAAQPGSLDFFLAERYLLYSVDRSGRLHSGRLHHTPYQLAQARVESYSKELFTLEGFEQPPGPPGPPCSQLVARPVEVSVFPLRPHQ